MWANINPFSFAVCSKFGKSSTNCNTDGPDPSHPDKLILLEEGRYYGHPNRKRGEKDPRQCKYRDIKEPSDNEYTAPIKQLRSSSNGICEWQSDHFGGGLRGDLIVGRYKGSLFNVKLANDGQVAVGGVYVNPPVLVDEGGLDVVQGPDGTLFVTSVNLGKLFYQAPVDVETTQLTVKSVFPRRGSISGGTPLKVYGEKLFVDGRQPTVAVGGKPCTVNGMKEYTDVAGKAMQWIQCTLPEAGKTGLADVLVTFGRESYTFVGGYRYISGGAPIPPAPAPTKLPAPQTAPSRLPTPSPMSLPVPSATTLPAQQPTLAPVSTSLVITDMILVDADTDKDIMPLSSCNGCITPSRSINVRVMTADTVGSVKITITGPNNYFHLQTENAVPYALFLDDNGNYRGRMLPSGSYTIRAQAFSLQNGVGTEGPFKTVTFSVASSRRLRSLSC